MSPSAASVVVTLESRFARELSELAAPWQAEAAPDPKLLVLNGPLATELGLDAEFLATDDGVRFLVGNSIPEGATPVAQAYSGHQFGWFSPRLGDGRALLLGEIADADGRLRDIHLKGSGRTPFARGGDGLAVIGPMLREYVVSEAMHALGVPTTRSLSVVATGRPVQRETVQPGAVLTRVASSHLRVGTFQFAAAGGDAALLRRLADHAIARHYPQVAHEDNRYLAFFDAVVARQAELVARWMLVGFVHGVMNTDNMTISGETIDYGPCAFIDAYDPAAVFSSIDETGRYAYRNQPGIAEWNLARFAETLLPLIAEEQERAVELAVQSLGRFGARYGTAWLAGVKGKLGLEHASDELVSSLAGELLGRMGEDRLDYTSFFRSLSTVARGRPAASLDAFAAGASLEDWSRRWLEARPDPDVMDRCNPAYIPRNHLVEEALTAATDHDPAPLRALLDAVTAPYEERPGLERFAEPAPDGLLGYRTFCGT